MNYESRLLKEAKVAFKRGETVTFIVNKREGRRFWRLKREVSVANGEEGYFEGD